MRSEFGAWGLGIVLFGLLACGTDEPQRSTSEPSSASNGVAVGRGGGGGASASFRPASRPVRSGGAGADAAGAAGRDSTPAKAERGADAAEVCVRSDVTHALGPDINCSEDAGVSLLSAAEPPGFGYDHQDNPGARVAYLTFDDGPSDWTPQFLDILAREKVKATFFVCAQHLKKSAGLDATFTDEDGQSVVFRDVLKRTVEEGHVLGNHTHNHVDLASLAPDALAQALDDNERLVNEALLKVGVAPRLLTFVRPPFGSPWHRGKVMPDDVQQARISIGELIAERGVNVLWNIDSSDSADWAQGESYTRLPVDPGRGDDPPAYADKVARIEQRVLDDKQIAMGESVIILMHDTHNATRDALPAVIAGLRSAGYSFGTLEELTATRWHRRSVEVTPGPRLYNGCVKESERGCSARSAGQRYDVCGRIWRAWQNAGGVEKVGLPVAEPMLDRDGLMSQAFEHGVIALHPERAAPCGAVWARPSSSEVHSR